MYARQIKITNRTGLHARPASNFTLKAKEFEAKIFIRNLDDLNSEAVNAKSVMKILAAGIQSGTTIEIAADGADEQNAVNALVDLVQSGLGES
ncbi:MAG: HPr family phosphocarrier protein [Leptolinea sp.]|jgi:phosphocarrier protein|nr:HPr family phosphocarrier protein [Leptolinea sp.]